MPGLEWLELQRPWLEEHIGAALSGRAYGRAIQCARALQHAHGATRARLVEALAAQDAWTLACRNTERTDDGDTREGDLARPRRSARRAADP
jgi:hypothetical protein